MSDRDNGRRTEPVHTLITGGAGFIGSHLAECLLQRGDHVTVIDNLSTGRMGNIAEILGHPRFQFVRETVVNADTVERLVAECDVVFHLAAAVGVQLIVRDPIHTFETNILGSHALLQAAARHHKKVLLASTSEIYGKSEQVPFGEDDDRVLGPTTVARWSYSTSKAVDEFLALAYHRQMALPVVIFRLFNTVGPRQTGQYGMVMPRFVQQALAGQPITVYGDGQQSRCFCDVADVVRAIVALAECPEAVGRVFNIGTMSEVTILSLARRILQLVNDLGGATPQANGWVDWNGEHDARVVLVPYTQAYDAGFEDMRRRVPDISRIAATIGWAPEIPLDETIRRIIAFVRASALASHVAMAAGAAG